LSDFLFSNALDLHFQAFFSNQKLEKFPAENKHSKKFIRLPKIIDFKSMTFYKILWHRFVGGCQAFAVHVLCILGA